VFLLLLGFTSFFLVKWSFSLLFFSSLSARNSTLFIGDERRTWGVSRAWFVAIDLIRNDPNHWSQTSNLMHKTRLLKLAG